jgi:hypothetical protein
MDLLPRNSGKSPGEKRQITPKTSPEKGIGQEGSGSSAANKAAVRVPLAADVAHVAKHAAKHVIAGSRHAAESATAAGGGAESVHVAGRGKKEGIAVRDAAFFAVGAAAAAAIVIAIRRG